MEGLIIFKLAAVFVLTISSWTPLAAGDRILFFLPMSSKSMANIFEPLAIALADRGHKLTVVAPVKFKFNPENKNVTSHVWYSPAELFTDYPDPFDLRRSNNLFSFPIPFQIKYCHIIFQNQEFQRIAHQKFDLVIVNPFYHDCFSGVWHKMEVPIEFVASLALSTHFTELLGNVMPSSIVPICTLADLDETLNFVQRTKNFLYNAYFQTHVDSMRSQLEKIYREYLGPDVPSIVQIYRKQVSLFLQNSHYALTNPRPLMPTVVEIGGIHCKKPKPLPKDLEEFVSGVKDGFIVFSLGSIVRASSVPEQVRLAFLNTFANLKQRVVWKWEKEEGMPDAPPNVKIVKWMPQEDLLGHPNIRLFITHGGLLSTEEAAFHGVPVLGMPVFVDQDANMRQAEILGFGIKGEILDITQAKLEPLVRRILDEPRYMEKAKNLSRIFQDQPQTSLERAVFWTEYILRHKGAYHLRSSGMNLNMIQYHCVDVVAFLVAIILFSFLLIHYILKLTIRAIQRSLISSNMKKKTEAYKKKKY